MHALGISFFSLRPACHWCGRKNIVGLKDICGSTCIELINELRGSIFLYIEAPSLRGLVKAAITYYSNTGRDRQGLPAPRRDQWQSEEPSIS